MTNAGRFRVQPVAGPIHAQVRVPGSKSITNRALVCAALAAGTTTLDGVLFADDTEAMIESLGRLGVAMQIDRTRGRITLDGLDGELPAGPVELDARLSGTTSRFLLGVFPLGEGPYILDGEPPLRARPMDDGIAAVRALGAEVVEQGEAAHLPLLVHGEADPDVHEIVMAGDVSSQFLSGVMLGAPCLARGLDLVIDGELVSRPYVEMTRTVMGWFGAASTWESATRLCIAPTGYRGADRAIEPDASAASYAFAAAAVCGGDVQVAGLGADALQGDVRFVDVLERMGADVTRARDAITVRVERQLHGVDADFTDISDTAQTLAVVAVFADTPTTITGIGFIRRKETDRLAATVTELRRCGIQAEELADGIRVHPGTPQPATVRTYDDHRMAMSFALLGLRAHGIEIADPDVVTKTFPGYWSMLGSLRSGGNLDEGD